LHADLESLIMSGLLQGETCLVGNRPQLGQTLNGLQANPGFGIMLRHLRQSGNDLRKHGRVILAQLLGCRHALVLVQIDPQGGD
jgi:hypothetical protein